MPVIKITTFEGKTNDYKKDIFNVIKNEIKKTLSIEHNNFHLHFIELKKENLISPEIMSENYVMIELIIFPGKNKEIKFELYNNILNKLAKFNIQKNDIIIIINDPAVENWFIRGKYGDELVGKK